MAIKKMKTLDGSAASTSEDSVIFERVKQYVQACPHASANHPAIKAAVEAIDRECNRMERDRKLQLRFSKKNATESITSSNLEDSIVVVGAEGKSPSNSPLPTAADNPSPSDELMEWQDVSEKEDEKDLLEHGHESAVASNAADGQESHYSSSFLGKQLAKIVIDTIAVHQVIVQSPLEALVVAFHASLRSEVLGFSCTGIPEDKASSSGGFAPPVRELSKTQFLPSEWTTTSSPSASNFSLRYRKSGTGALVLQVKKESRDANDQVTVHIQPSSNKEPSGQSLVIGLGDYINLSSWQAAAVNQQNKNAPGYSKGHRGISPALHYKHLALLLTNFCRSFDLGSVMDNDGTQNPASTAIHSQANAIASPYVDQTIIHKSDLTGGPLGVPTIAANNRYDTKSNWKQGVPSTLGEAFPNRYPVGIGGDFSGDLAPAGLRDPRFMPGAPGMGGSLMGPNHPMFSSGGVAGIMGPGGIPIGGPGSMQPRFDPIFPAGINPHSGVPGQRGKPPSRTGAPNPDHLPPPDALGGNMFS